MATARCLVALLLLNLKVCSHAFLSKKGFDSNGQGVDLDSLSDEVDEGAGRSSRLHSRSGPRVNRFLDVFRRKHEDSSAGVGSDEGAGRSSRSHGHSGPIINLSPEARSMKHATEFEKDFVVELNMTWAHETGAPLGLRVDMDESWTPPSVMKVKKHGCVEHWNQANPEKSIHPGDQIVQVNDVLWHHNTETFVTRIKGQFVAGRAWKPGANRILTLQVQRPRQENQTRFSLQRKNLHEKLYAKEFTVELHLPENETRPTMASALGWQLNATVNWEPITIGTIEKEGVLAQWNMAHPDNEILEGDEIIQVNKRRWLHNSSSFLSHLIFNFKHCKELMPDGIFSLGLRRPRKAHDDNSHRIEEVDTTAAKRFTAILEASKMHAHGSDEAAGWQLAVSNNQDPVEISTVQSGGALANWNAQHPNRAIFPGDQIMEVNHILWQSNSHAFVDAISDQLQASLELNENVSLVLQRRGGQGLLFRSMDTGGPAVLERPASTDTAAGAEDDDSGVVGAGEDAYEATD